MFAIKKFTLSMLFLVTAFTLGFPVMAESAEIDVSKESKRLAARFKGVRVYYSGYAGVDERDEGWGNVDNPPLMKLLNEAGAIIVPISEAKYSDIQIAYYWHLNYFLWVSISKNNKVLFSHEYTFEGFFPRASVVENMLIRDLDSEEVF